ncbi:hypothetical protein HMI54_003166 [Coelomomyces lativittatus]|nr:hypothetical protein HMI56_002630 [Coelomomyces lativittatus]KAJ1508531.1 hypothetical protein HMI54_003166 [Coelomomyces lativittatus]KAJ1515665.1 hypothetical protein HMI55_003459 [Coelomomyces lativittatus]
MSSTSNLPTSEIKNDEIFASTMPSTLETINQLPPRPGRCSVGSSISVMANSFVVHIENPETLIYYYELKVEPETKGVPSRFLFNVWKEMYFDAMPLPGPCFYDGKRTMLTSTSLSFEPSSATEQTYQIMFPVTTRMGVKKVKVEKQFFLTIKHIAVLKLKDLQNYLFGNISTEHSIFNYTSAVGMDLHEIFWFIAFGIILKS